MRKYKASTALSINRHLNLNEIINYIVWGDLKLQEFKIDGEYISIQVDSDEDLDIGLFDQFIRDLEFEYDMQLLEAC